MTHSGMWGVGQAPCLPYPPMFSSASSVLASSVLESALGAGKQNSEGFSPVWPAKCPSTSVVRSWGSYVQRGKVPSEMTWLVKLFRQESPVLWLADSQEGKPDMRTSQDSLHTHTLSLMYIHRRTSVGERDYVTLPFEIRGEKKACGGTSQPNGSLVSMAAPPSSPPPSTRQMESSKDGKAPLSSSPRRRGRRPRADPASEPLVVVNHFDAGVLLLNLSSQLRLQPAHVYGAVTEEQAG